ncbi:hypothetical protein MesoLj113c_46370 [Mesorhizobium sp. 113-3-9]|uniref:hypothetical protein n=1 Tax=Mesorhizobium sp. 113-3-9 TaxID=2744517 RepID=UPI001927F7D5|nr:hypothetical protein [Mesorhizobium sp. 113-3-9]BCG88527.1 hypothetical protein MesoLj113c_46370 [Mesorhizobium sp. 113-3-9]
MPNVPVRAAAEGMPNLSRRRLLLGLAAASTAAAVGTVAAHAGAKAAPVENPDLIAIGNLTPAIEQAYVDAWEHEESVVRKWAPKWPTAPAALTAKPSHSSELERDFFGAHHGRHIYTSDYFEWRLDRAGRALKSRSTSPGSTRDGWRADFDEASRLLVVAKKYERRTASIQKASGYTSAWKARHAAAQALAAHITAVLDQPDITIEGMLIKAEALAVWGRVPEKDRIWAAVDRKRNWHGQIAESVLRHAKGGVA